MEKKTVKKGNDKKDWKKMMKKDEIKKRKRWGRRIRQKKNAAELWGKRRKGGKKKISWENEAGEGREIWGDADHIYIIGGKTKADENKAKKK